MIKCHHSTFSSKLHYKERGESLDTMEKRTIVRAKKKINVAKSMLRNNLSYIRRMRIWYYYLWLCFKIDCQRWQHCKHWFKIHRSTLCYERVMTSLILSLSAVTVATIEMSNYSIKKATIDKLLIDAESNTELATFNFCHFSKFNFVKEIMQK